MRCRASFKVSLMKWRSWEVSWGWSWDMWETNKQSYVLPLPLCLCVPVNLYLSPLYFLLSSEWMLMVVCRLLRQHSTPSSRTCSICCRENRSCSLPVPPPQCSGSCLLWYPTLSPSFLLPLLLFFRSLFFPFFDISYVNEYPVYLPSPDDITFKHLKPTTYVVSDTVGFLPSHVTKLRFDDGTIPLSFPSIFW